MLSDSFNQLPDNARVWIFPLLSPLSEAQAEALRARLNEFLDNWLTHKAPTNARYELRDSQFLIVAATTGADQISGCAIDTLFHAVTKCLNDLGTAVGDRSVVFFRDASHSIQSVSRDEFQELVNREKVTADTIVFDTTHHTLAALRKEPWERPFSTAWHAQAFLRPG